MKITSICPKCKHKYDFDYQKQIDKEIFSAVKAEREQQKAKSDKELKAALYQQKAENDKKLKDFEAKQKAENDKKLKGIEAKQKAENDKKLKAALYQQKTENDKKLKAFEAKQKAENDKKLKGIETKQQQRAEDIAASKVKEKIDKLNKRVELLTGKNQLLADELKRTNQQVSSELKGEIQEGVIEDYIEKKFKKDRLEPIKKGKRGADSILHITLPNGQVAGRLLIESKDTENYSNNWHNKIVDDMINVNANCGIIISKALPSNFPKDQGFAEIKKNKVALCRFDYTHIFSIIELFRDSIIRSSQINIRNNNSNLHLKCWEWIKNPNFQNRYMKMYSTSCDLQNDLKRILEFNTKAIASSQNKISNFQEIQREFICELIQSVGEEHLPRKLIKYDEDID